MPKLNNTKLQKALELRRLVNDGPSMNFDVFGGDCGQTWGLTQDQRAEIQSHFAHKFRIWSQSWVVPLVEELVPQLKDK